MPGRRRWSLAAVPSRPCTSASTGGFPAPSATRTSSCDRRWLRSVSTTMSGRPTSLRPALDFGALRRMPWASFSSSASRDAVACIVDEDVDPAEARDHGVDCLPEIGAVGDVRIQRDHLDFPANGVCRCFRRAWVQIEHRQHGAFTCEQLAGCAPNPRSAACDQSDLVPKPHAQLF